MGRAAWRHGGDVVLGALVAAAVIGAVAARRQAPWIPTGYLASIPTLLVVIWVATRWRARTRAGARPWRIAVTAVAAAVLLALMPVPWMTAALDVPPGTAWRLDGRLTIEGRRVDPPGEWYWLTVGRPPIVAEVVAGWFGDAPAPASMRRGSAASQPAFNEPAAAAVGLRAAGRPIELTLVVEGRWPTVPGLPSSTLITEINGIALTSRDAWQQALDSLEAPVAHATDASIPGPGGAVGATFVDGDGTLHRFTAPDLPFERVVLLDVPAESLDAAIRGPLAGTPPESWFRKLALGRSHGLMIALVAYAHESGTDLARGRAIAGTGGVRGDGSVVRIGGLRSKAEAAARAGADLMFFPGEQAGELDGFDPGDMVLVPVTHLDEAIAALTS